MCNRAPVCLSHLLRSLIAGSSRCRCSFGQVAHCCCANPNISTALEQHRCSQLSASSCPAHLGGVSKPNHECVTGMCFFGKQKYVAAISCLKRASYLGETRSVFPQPCVGFCNDCLNVNALTDKGYSAAPCAGFCNDGMDKP